MDHQDSIFAICDLFLGFSLRCYVGEGTSNKATNCTEDSTACTKTIAALSNPVYSCSSNLNMTKDQCKNHAGINDTMNTTETYCVCMEDLCNQASQMERFRTPRAALITLVVILIPNVAISVVMY